MKIILTGTKRLNRETRRKLSKISWIDRVVTVHVNDAQEEVAQTIKDWRLLAIPVVDDTNTLVGIITVDDALDVIVEEATSDYSVFTGVDVDEAHQGVGRDC